MAVYIINYVVDRWKEITMFKLYFDCIVIITILFLILFAHMRVSADTALAYAEEYTYFQSGEGVDNGNSEKKFGDSKEAENQEYGTNQEYSEITDEEIALNVDSIIKSLNSLGITEANEVREPVLEWFYKHPKDALACMEISEWTGNILSVIGMGKYDYDYNKWISRSKQVYSFDAEVFAVDNMYGEFLEGIIPLMDNNTVITDIEEDTGGVDYESGTGTQIIRFKCNGNSYEFAAEVYYDWFQFEFVDYMNEVLEKEGTDKRLLVTYDGGQVFIIFYNTLEWAEEFHEIMGYELLNVNALR